MVMRTCNHSKGWETLDPNATIAWQGKLLHRFLNLKVLPFSEHYQKLFLKEGLEADHFRTVSDLQRLPFTSKADLLPNPENARKHLDFALIPEADVLARLPRVILRALWRGRGRVKAELEEEFRPVFMTSTTGRSADPIPFLYTHHDLRNLALGGSRLIEIGQAGREDRLLNLFPYAPHLAYWLTYHAALEKNLFCVGSGGGKTIGTEGNIRLIGRLKPSILVGMPTFLYHVLQQAMEEGARFEGIKLIVLGGEKVSSGTRRKLIELCAEVGSHEVAVIATYGFTEAKMAWVECPFASQEQSSGYHLYPDLGIVEIIDPKTGEVLPDGTGGEIVYTPLNARGTVVLRYRTGDYIENGIVTEPCPYCGRRSPRLQGKISRVTDIHSMQLQKLKGTLVDFNVLENLLDDIPHVGSWQLELRKLNDDPNEMDELLLHVCKQGAESEEVLAHDINTRFSTTVEIRPNRIQFHSTREMRRLHKVGHVLKEEKIVDRRDLDNPSDANWKPPHWAPVKTVLSKFQRLWKRGKANAANENHNR